MQLAFLQSGAFLLLVQNSLSSHDSERFARLAMPALGIIALLCVAWYALGRMIEGYRYACRLYAMGATEKQAMEILKAETRNDTGTVREEWDAYALQHRLEIARIADAFRREMEKKHKLRASWLDIGLNENAPPLVPCAALIHAGKKTPEEAGEALFAFLKLDGETGNPRIFTADAQGEPFPVEAGAGSTLNKALFGVYGASGEHAAMTAVFIILLAGSFYGYTGGLFLPQAGWWWFGMGASCCLSLFSALWIAHGHISGKILVRSSMGKGTRALAAIIMMPLLFFLYWGTLTLATGSALTELSGDDRRKHFKVMRTVRKTSYGKKFCLASDYFQRRAVFFPDDCTLSEEQFKALPSGGGYVEMNVRESMFGTLLKGMVETP